MYTVAQLYKSAKNSGLSKLPYDLKKVHLFDVEIFEDSILFKFPVKSFTYENTVYQTNVLFKDVKFTDEEHYKRDRNVARTKLDGVWYYFVKPTVNSYVQVSCTCLNYCYTWAFPNARYGNHYGPLPVLPKPKGVRPPRNPKKLPGMCKHCKQVFNGLYGYTSTELL